MTSQTPIMSSGLELHESDDGMIVYQDATDKVHYLNHTAAVVLQLCDGTRDVQQIAAAVAELFELAEPPISETKSCIDDLSREGLIA